MQSHDHVTNRLAHVNLKLHFLGHTWWACRLPPLTHPCRACLLKLFFFLPIQGMVFENFPLSPAWHAGLSYFSFPAYIGSSSWNHLLSCPHEARLLKLSPFYHPYMACLEKFCLAPPIRGVASETHPSLPRYGNMRNDLTYALTIAFAFTFAMPSHLIYTEICQSQVNSHPPSLADNNHHHKTAHCSSTVMLSHWQIQGTGSRPSCLPPQDNLECMWRTPTSQFLPPYLLKHLWHKRS